MTNELSTIIANVGFPIAISMYLLVRIEGKLQMLSDSITQLSKTLVEFNK
ncbi:MAG: YvrJ family protein [Peptostreptococcaceae bacterium]|nr:YvrJ family protein [Peptostreptococcaceae bacterium]